ncbi:MAG: hypothetical protein HKP13_11150 [Gammaproteobacteria bacterium]|nr:hypothetical protein [Gammaproteobacteria bacterium]
MSGLAALREQFRYYLISTVKACGVSVLAEELNEDVLAIFNATESSARVVAGELGISHLFCEPSFRMRASLGFTKQLQRKHHFVRERLWYDKIANYKGQRIIFICGANHVPTFAGLVRDKGQRVVILTAYYGRDFFESVTPHRFCQILCPRNPPPAPYGPAILSNLL